MCSSDLNEIAKKAEISQRQIDRLRNYSGREFPEGESINKLATVLPEIKNIRPEDFCNRLIAPWDLVKKDQEDISKKYVEKVKENPDFTCKIYIVSGWEKPQALKDDDICQSVVENIDRGLEYEFIFPPLDSCPQDVSSNEIEDGKTKLLKWLRFLKRSVDIRWYSQQKADDNIDLEKYHADFKVKINEGLKFSYTKNSCNRSEERRVGKEC